jgi:hypothetical protein
MTVMRDAPSVVQAATPELTIPSPSRDEQAAKLRLVVETAAEVWG